MRDRIAGLLDRADVAVASCAGVFADEEVGPLLDAVRNARIRLAYPAEVLVVALAGGTGSGKSSLLNAMVGEEVVEAGGVRPTTSEPEAAVPTSWSDAMGAYLDRLGVTERHDVDLDDTCVIDLPDIDSVELAHHHRVDELLPKVDLVVWVTDPEKYKDARLHHDYLRPLASSAEQFLFVLNQSDRLSSDQICAVLDDFSAALREDGIESPSVLATAAAPASGAPSGIEDVLASIEERREARDVLYDKVLDDLQTALVGLESPVEAPSDYDARAEVVRDTAAATLASGDLGRATDGVVGFLSELALEAGGGTGDALRRLAADAPQHLVRVESTVPERLVRKSIWRRKSLADPAPTDYLPGLDEAIFRPARAHLAKRAVALDALTELGVELGSMRSETHR